MKVLVAIPWQEKCQSLRLIRSLVPPEHAKDFMWFRKPGTPGDEPLLGENLFNIEPFPRWRLLNSVLFRTRVYHAAQEFLLTRRVKRLVLTLRQLLVRAQPDAVWGLGHLHQVLVLEEALRELPIPLHLTVHDEPAALSQRVSRWPHRQSRMIEWAWPRLLQQARSADCVCEGMADYLREKYRRDAVVLMPCPRLPLSETPPPAFDGNLCVGLSGSGAFINSISTLLAGLAAMVESKKLKSVEVCWLDGHPLAVPSAIRVRVLGFLEEREAVCELTQCHLLYLPHSFDTVMKAARVTAFPSKLSMYLPSCRPILFHAPDDASAVRFSRRTGTGAVWNSLEVEALPALLDELLTQASNFTALREHYLRLLDEEFNLDRNRKKLWSLFCQSKRPAALATLKFN